MSSFEVFKSFYSEEEAVALRDLLLNKGIEAKVEKSRDILDKTIIGDGLDPHIHLKVRNTDFTKSNQIIDEYIGQHMASLDPDYYLFSFTDKELLEIVHKPDEWNNQDVMIARKLLADRDLVISDQQVAAIKESRYRELAQPEKNIGEWLILGYVAAIVFSPGALIMALFLRNAKKVMPDGTKVMMYDKRTRFHCSIIACIAAFVILQFLINIFYTPWITHYIKF